jgi:hypothetical protein
MTQDFYHRMANTRSQHQARQHRRRVRGDARMPTILSQKRTPVYNSVGELVGHNVETLSTIDPPGTPPAKPLATAVHTCAQCHQAQTACR